MCVLFANILIYIIFEEQKRIDVEQKIDKYNDNSDVNKTIAVFGEKESKKGSFSHNFIIIFFFSLYKKLNFVSFFFWWSCWQW